MNPIQESPINTPIIGFERNFEMNKTFTMSIETKEGVKPHGFHLGTQFDVAKKFVLEALAKEETISVALYEGKKLWKIYDFRDLKGK